MFRLIPLEQIPDIDAVALEVHDRLRHIDNADIALDFPDMYDRLTRDPGFATACLRESAAKCEPGVREVFIAALGSAASNKSVFVGMSIVTAAPSLTRPEAVVEGAPNVSYLVVEPFRNLGLGHRTLAAQLDVVEERFGGHAWSQVRPENTPSIKVLEAGGFVPLLTDESANTLLYVYPAKGQ